MVRIVVFLQQQLLQNLNWIKSTSRQQSPYMEHAHDES